MACIYESGGFRMRDLISRKEVLTLIDNMYQDEKDLIRSVWVRDSIKSSIYEKG